MSATAVLALENDKLFFLLSGRFSNSFQVGGPFYKYAYGIFHYILMTIMLPILVSALKIWPPLKGGFKGGIRLKLKFVKFGSLMSAKTSLSKIILTWHEFWIYNQHLNAYHATRRNQPYFETLDDGYVKIYRLQRWYHESFIPRQLSGNP